MKQETKKELRRAWAIVILVYSAMILSAYATGYRALLYISLSFIPLFFLAWGVSLLLTGKRNREIYRHLTAEEKERFVQMSMNYGKTVGRKGIYIVIPFCIIVLASYVVIGPNYWLVYVALFLLLMLATLIVTTPQRNKQRKEAERFFLSTEYARRKGWSVKQSNL
jgi:hypothetical protein